jgi:hypothetical protein
VRKLNKLPKPHILEVKEDVWTTAYVSAVAAGTAKNAERWRHEEIKLTLDAETDGKCAYCESLVLDVAYPHVEHIVPKAIHPELAHRWHNLTWACPKCNVAKDVAYHPTEGVLNPYVDDIEAHLVFHGDFIDSPLGDPRGAITVIACDLNRYDLVRSRVARLCAVRDLVVRWHGEVGPMREALATAIRLDAERGEYTAVVGAYLKRVGFPLDPVDPPDATP